MRLLPAGERALLVEFTDAGDVDAWFGELRRRWAAGQLTAVDIVPAARTILLDGLADVAATRALLAEVQRQPVSVRPADDADRCVEVPVRYDGADVAEVARLWRMTEEEVVATHVATTFRVAFCGFSPGFAYLTGLPDRLHTPRRGTPRTCVPAGSVALAGAYTGIYPSTSPGGWQLLGRTDLTLFDVDRDPPALLTPGTTVRFRRI